MNFSALAVVFVNRWPAVVCFTTFEHTAVTATVLHLAKSCASFTLIDQALFINIRLLHY